MPPDVRNASKSTAVEVFVLPVDKCYCCGDNARHPYAFENGFELVKCATCGLLYTTERPDDDALDDAHRQGKHAGEREFDITGGFDRRKLRTYDQVLDVLYGAAPPHSPVTNSCRWLDVGCGHGELLMALRSKYDAQVDAQGSEPNVHKQRGARERGLNVGFTPLDALEGPFDVVSLMNVYSHIPDPPGFLLNLRRLLAPGGEVFIETGDTADLPADLHYRPFYLPDHLSFASESILSRVLAEANFEVVGLTKMPYLNLDLATVVKETVKAILPGRATRLPALFRRRQYGQTDMFIRARLKANPSGTVTT